ncbi:MerR family transcriptional regulator [Pseudonocardia sp. KRD291]|uniref:MerR family transcriptional regulator n=1 Tax=Pseudonocardia sp. KRD291 TaxID=2792007 RepID=UPI001C4A08AC|nr:MerR family transcriptional regulator [Pseudonocardia sp. KRD291]MBW0102385.1 MerR family transcriptional regulator [Pseudonocardia sp. KRD291]
MGKPQTGVRGADVLRPVDLAREHGLSAQAVRNYERDGILPAARRAPNGYRAYTDLHAVALRAHVALVAAHGHATGAEVMRAVERGDQEPALRAIDDSHLRLLRDRETLDVVEAAVGSLTRPPADPDRSGRPDRPVAVGALAHRLGVVPATLRAWERAGILVPAREGGARRYCADDVRDAELAHLLRRGGYPLAHIAVVVEQVRRAGGPEPLAASIADWRARLDARARAMLTAAGRLADYLQARDGEPRSAVAAAVPSTDPGS